MDKEKFSDTQFTVGPIPFNADPKDVYPPVGAKFLLHALENGKFRYELISLPAGASMPDGWVGAEFEFIPANDDSFPLPVRPMLDGSMEQYEPADRFFATANLGPPGQPLPYSYDLWFVAGPDAYAVDDSMPPTDESLDPAFNAIELIAALAGTGVQNGSHKGGYP